jgi:transcriptional regulator with XRE-family HTH domain
MGGPVMKLREKLKVLREVEGMCRGLPREISKAEMVKLIWQETGERISLAYLSQLEGGSRKHMTNRTRLLLAKFFRIHPGYLVDDPEEFQRHVATPSPDSSDAFVPWLRVGAARFRHEPVISETLERLASYPERRKAMRLFRELLAMPALMDRLLHTVETKKG